MSLFSTSVIKFFCRGIQQRDWQIRTYSVFVLTCSLLAASTASADLVENPYAERVVDLVDQGRYEHFLTADNLLYTHNGDNRHWGEEHDLARDNIAALFTSFGLETSLHEFTYREATYANVVAVLPGTITPEQIYVIGAHYDSTNSRGRGDENGAPGADDNASGVAGVLEAARVLSQFEVGSTVVFAAFDREEQGLYGSRAWVEDHVDEDIRGMISLDMIGFHPFGPKDEGYQKARINYATDNSPVTVALAESLLQYGDITGEISRMGRSDHAPFDDEGFDSALLIEYAVFDNPNYHKWTDSVDTIGYIDYEYATNMTRGVVGYLAESAFAIPIPRPGIYRWDTGDLITIEDAVPSASFFGMNLAHADLAGKNLAGASFLDATLTDAKLDRSDLRGANVSATQIAATVSTKNTILPDGHIEGLALEAGEQLVVRDHDGPSSVPITIESGVDLDPESTVRIVLDGDGWGSTMTCEPGISASLAGMLGIEVTDRSANVGERTSTVLALAEDDTDNSILGQFDTVPDEGQHLGVGNFFRGVVYVGSDVGMTRAVEVSVFEAAPGDVDGNGLVDVFDVFAIKASARGFGTGMIDATWTDGDVVGNGPGTPANGIVDLWDILAIKEAGLFGVGPYAARLQIANQAAGRVPEPGALLLLLTGAACLLGTMGRALRARRDSRTV